MKKLFRIRSMVPGLVFIAAAGCASAPPPAAPVPLVERIDENRWAESLLSQMPLEDRIGQVLAVRIPGEFSNVRSPAFVQAEHAVRDVRVGVVLVDGGSPAELALKTNALQRRARVPLLVVRDAPLTFGASQNMIEPAGVGATGDAAQAERAGGIAGREARAVGIHWITPPPAGAYASDSAAAAGFAAAFARGAAQAGALTGGLVIRDASDPAWRRAPGWSPGAGVVWSLETGADVVIVPSDFDAARAALLVAVQTGRITEARINDSARKVLELKARLGLNKGRMVEPDSVGSIVGAPESEAAAAEMAARALILARDDAGMVPFDARKTRDPLVVVIAGKVDAQSGSALAREVLRIFGGGSVLRLNELSTPADLDVVAQHARTAGAIVVATYLAPDASPDAMQVQRAALRRVAETNRPAVLVAFGAEPSPGDVLLPARMLAWQTHGPAAELAAARALAGLLPITGRLSVEIPGLLPGAGLARSIKDYQLAYAEPQQAGMDPLLLSRADSVVQTAIVNRAAPGVSLAVGRYGNLLRSHGYGSSDWRPGYAPVNDGTLYDLASLTKVVATTTAVMILYDEGLLDLNAPVAHYLPEFAAPGCLGAGGPAGDTPCNEAVRGSKSSVTVRQLLTHSAGLPAWAPLYRSARGRLQYMDRIAALPLEYVPGNGSIYSDFSPILLQLIVERLSGQMLDAFSAARIFEPLGMRDTRFNPLRSVPVADTLGCVAGTSADPLILQRIAPTAPNPDGRSLHGIVHDDNACAIGGVSGHAGLFSSARDLAVFAQMLLNGGFYGGQRIVKPATIDMFTRRQDAFSSRAFGWDTPTRGASQGDYFSPNSFGHTGFTGTSIWLDKDRDLFVVLLANRLNTSSDNQRHLALRRAVHDAAAQAISDTVVEKRPGGSGR